MNQGQLGDHLGSISGVFDPFGNIWIWTVKKFGNGWSKSIVLENKVVLNFDFRNEAGMELWLSLNLTAKEQNKRAH